MTAAQRQGGSGLSPSRSGPTRPIETIRECVVLVATEPDPIQRERLIAGLSTWVGLTHESIRHLVEARRREAA